MTTATAATTETSAARLCGKWLQRRISTRSSDCPQQQKQPDTIARSDRRRDAEPQHRDVHPRWPSATQQGQHQNCNRDYQHRIKWLPEVGPSPKSVAASSRLVVEHGEVVGGRVPTLRGDKECKQCDGPDPDRLEGTKAQAAEHEIGTKHAHTEQHGAVQVAPDCDEDRGPPDPLGHPLVFRRYQRDQQREGQHEKVCRRTTAMADTPPTKTTVIPQAAAMSEAPDMRAVHASTTSDMAASVTCANTRKVSPPARPRR